MTEAIDLDHVAIASEHALDNFVRYRGDLGGEWLHGGYDPGFWWGQVRFAGGMRLEMLEPANIEVHDFLRRFLDRNGPGPHHFTFKVPDIHAAIDLVTEAGYPPVRVNTGDEYWQEAFLHPKQSHGIVVQLAQTIEHDHAARADVPPARVAGPATLERAVHAVADLDAARALFSDTLGGQPSGGGDGVDLVWPGGGTIRLVAASAPELAAWLGGRPGRFHHLAFTLPDPAALPGSAPLGGGVYEVPPALNLGVRLRLQAPPLTEMGRSTAAQTVR